MKTKAICTVLFSLLLGAASAQAGGFSLSYGGRLANAGDEAVKGPVDLEIGFYKSAKGSDVITVIPKANVSLEDGIFQVDLDLTATERSQIIGDGSNPVWVEVSDKTNKKVYPRQMLSAVPYAIAAQTVPVDGTTIQFNSDGKLKANFAGPSGTDVVTAINTSGTAGTINSSRLPGLGGELSGTIDGASVSKLNGKPINWSGFGDGKILRYNGSAGEWQTATASGSGTVNSVGLVTPTEGIGASGGPITSSGSITLSLSHDLGAVEGISTTGVVKRTAANTWTAGTVDLASSDVTGVLPITRGGTGASTQPTAANAILPAQASLGGKFLKTDGTNVSWATPHSLDASDGTPTNAVFVDADGKVGIGNTSPSTSLHLKTASATTALTIENTTSTSTLTQSSADFAITNNVFGKLTLGTNGAGRLTVSAAGDVGIGSTTPGARLDVAGELKVGSTGVPCNSSNIGKIRYNAIQKINETCLNLSGGANWQWARIGERRLTTNLVYYVRTDGNDSNDGLSNSSSGAFLTIQAAIRAAQSLDIGNNNVDINIGDGTYDSPIVVSGPWRGSGQVTLVGNTTTPGNVTITNSSGHALVVTNNATLVISGATLESAAGSALVITEGASVVTNSGIVFGASLSDHIKVSYHGRFRAAQAYGITGGAQSHIFATRDGIAEISGLTVSLSNAPSFTSGFAAAHVRGLIVADSVTYSGGTNASTAKFTATTGGLIVTGGLCSSLPGGVSGTTTSLGDCL